MPGSAVVTQRGFTQEITPTMSLGQVRLLLFDDLAAAHHVHGGLAGHEAEHVEVDVLVIFDFDDVLGAVTLGVGVHDERKLGFGRVDFQVFENLQRGSGRHMVDNDAVLNAGDFHQA